jgi:hypothetical protein
LFPSVNRSPFSVPDTQTPFIQPLSLLLIAPLQPVLLLVGSPIFLIRCREAKERVIVNGISCILPLLVCIPEMREIRRKGIAIEEYNMGRVDGADGVVDSIIEGDNAGMLRVGWFIKRVVTSDPFVILVVLGQSLPEPYGAVLEIFVVPNCFQGCQFIHLVWINDEDDEQLAMCPP